MEIQILAEQDADPDESSRWRQVVHALASSLRNRNGWLAVLAAVVLIAGLPSEALASEKGGRDDAVHQVEELLQKAPGMQAERATASQATDSSIVAEEGGGRVEIPLDGSRPITMNDTDGNEVRLELPKNLGLKRNKTKQSAVGLAGKNTKVVVEALAEGGFRVLTVMENSEAPNEYTYKIDTDKGVKLVDNEGAVEIQDKEGNHKATVLPPFAIDAEGKAVPTWFSVSGNKLTQHVDTSQVEAWPVLLDPWVSSYWWGQIVRLSRWETRVIGYGMEAASVYFGWTHWVGVLVWSTGHFARWAADNGWCLAFWRTWVGTVRGIWLYRCWG